MPYKFLLGCFCAFSFFARAESENNFERFLGSLSKGAHYLHGNSCANVNESEAGPLLSTAAAAVCAKLGQTGTLTRQAENFNQISELAGKKAEDKFFALLSLQHSLELKCAAGGAEELSKEDSGGEKMKNLAGKIVMLRDAKLKLAGIASGMSAKGLGPCSFDGSDEKPNPNYTSQGQSDPRAESCRELRIARLTFQSLYESVPLAGTPSMKQYLNTAQVDRSLSEETTDKIAADLKLAYMGAQKELSAEAERLRGLGERGGDKIDRATRRALAADPRRIQELVDAGGNSPALQAVACDADARYGAGAKSFELMVTVGSIALTPLLGAATLPMRGASVLRAVAGARAAGSLSVAGTRLLQLGLVGTGAAAAYESLDRACWSKDSPRLVARGGSQCRDDFSIEQIKKEDCRLAGVMTAVGGATLLASSRAVRGFVAGALKGRPAAVAPPPSPIVLNTEKAVGRFDEYGAIKWRKDKLGEMFGDNAFEIRDASVKSGSRSSYVRFSQNPADDFVNEPYITIDMVRGDPERKGLGQYLIKRVATENPGRPIYGALARENGARFKTVFRDLAGKNLDDEILRSSVADIPALRSIPGRALLKPKYDEAGNLVDMGVVRYPDYSKSSVEITNLREVTTDPRFRRWMDGLRARPSNYFEPNPEFNRLPGPK